MKICDVIKKMLLERRSFKGSYEKGSDGRAFLSCRQKPMQPVVSASPRPSLCRVGYNTHQLESGKRKEGVVRDWPSLSILCMKVKCV